jgi:hypothetical protein
VAEFSTTTSEPGGTEQHNAIMENRTLPTPDIEANVDGHSPSDDATLERSASQGTASESTQDGFHKQADSNLHQANSVVTEFIPNLCANTFSHDLRGLGDLGWGEGLNASSPTFVNTYMGTWESYMDWGEEGSNCKSHAVSLFIQPFDVGNRSMMNGTPPVAVKTTDSNRMVRPGAIAASS